MHNARLDMVVVVGHTSRALTISVGSAKRFEVWYCTKGIKHHSEWPIPEAFNRLQPLSGPNGTYLYPLSDFLEGVCNIFDAFSISPYKHQIMYIFLYL